VSWQAILAASGLIVRSGWRARAENSKAKAAAAATIEIILYVMAHRYAPRAAHRQGDSMPPCRFTNAFRAG